MKLIFNREYPLIAENVDEAAETVYEILNGQFSMTAKESLRIRLSVEEIMLRWMNSSPQASVDFRVEQRGKKLDLSISLFGANTGVPRNPLRAPADEAEGSAAETILSNLGVS